MTNKVKSFLAGPTVAEYNVIRIITALRGLFEVDIWEYYG